MNSLTARELIMYAGVNNTISVDASSIAGLSEASATYAENCYVQCSGGKQETESCIRLDFVDFDSCGVPPDQVLEIKPLIVESAAGTITLLCECFAPERGKTRMWLGILGDGRYVVSSRWQYEIKTKDRQKAIAVFNALGGDVGV